MKTLFVLALLSLLGGFASQDANAAVQSSYDLRSPDGRIEVRIRAAGLPLLGLDPSGRRGPRDAGVPRRAGRAAAVLVMAARPSDAYSC